MNEIHDRKDGGMRLPEKNTTPGRSQQVEEKLTINAGRDEHVV